MLNLVRLAVIVAGALGVRAGVRYLSRKKVFISFAIEDKGARDLLVGQSRNKNAPFEFTDMSVKESHGVMLGRRNADRE